MSAVRFAARADHVQTIVDAAVAAANPARLVREHVRRDERGVRLAGVTVPAGGRVWLVASGKAALTMARAAASVLGSALAGGVVVDKLPAADVASADWPPVLHYFQGGHPVPTAGSVAAARAVADLLRGTSADDIVLCLISGGTSALLTDPRLDLGTWQMLNRALLHSGCPIEAINHVRARFDPIKAGGLARLAAPARCVSLILSDVIGNPLPSIGSGPTVPTAPAPVRPILTRYDVLARLPADAAARVRAALSAAPAAAPSTPAPHNVVVGDVRLAAIAARDAAATLGFAATVLTTYLEGEAREAGGFAVALAKGAAPNRCLILGGETTVTLRGDGRGGRNQELALAAALALDGWPRAVVASAATDGDDGLPPPGERPMAGAWVDGETVATAAEVGLDAGAHLDANDSYAFFARLGRGHIAAARGTNVNDLIVILTYAPDED